MKQIIFLLLITSFVISQSMVYSKKYKSTSDADIWRNEMTNRIAELSVRLEEQEEQLEKYSEYLIAIMRILRQKLERENSIFEDLIEDKTIQYLQEEINVLKYKYLEQEEINERFFHYMMYK